MAGCYIPIPVKCDDCENKPYIGDNGNWWVGNQDTGAKAQGPNGDDGVMLETYSTAKTAIGTWIDGKTIYRIVKEVEFTPEDNQDFTGFLYYLSGIQVDQVISVRGYVELTNTAYNNNKFVMNIPICNKRTDIDIDYYYSREFNAVEISGSLGVQYKIDRLFVVVEFTEH